MALYDALVAMLPTPVVRLNRAVAIAMVHGPAAGLADLDVSGASAALDGYHLYHATRADMLRRLGRHAEGARAYRRSLELAATVAERSFLERRLAETEGQEGVSAPAPPAAAARRR